MFQVLKNYSLYCSSSTELPQNKSRKDKYSIVVITPEKLENPLCLLQMFHHFQKHPISKYTSIIGLVNSKADVSIIKQSDIFGSNKLSLTIDNIPGLHLLEMPFKLPSFLHILKVASEDFIDGYDYLRLRSISKLGSVCKDLKLLITSSNPVKFINKYNKLINQITNLDLNFILSHHEGSELKDILSREPSIENLKKIEAILR